MGADAEMGGELARPVAFSDCAGWFHPASGRAAVLLIGPWGYEALCLRRAWRMLGDALAAAGYPALRFDFPGCGDSLGRAEDLGSLEPLMASVRRASAELKVLTGARRLVLVGHGLGASLAALMADELDAAAVGLLAPLVRGKEYLRELSVWGLTVAEAMQLETGDAGPGAVAGFGLPDGLRAALAQLDIAPLAGPLPPAFIAVRGRASESRLVERLRAGGSAVREMAYANHDLALGNPTVARPPAEVIAGLVDWLVETVPPERGGSAAAPTAAMLESGDFLETALRFGPGDKLCGVLCEPKNARRGATVLMLSAGGDPHIGWARGAVEQARALAADGIASFRVDASDVGDAAGPLTDQSVRLYDERHIDDAMTAFEWLLSRGFGPVLPVGRCSGAFAAFNAAARDPRISDIMLVNQLRYIWERDGDYERASEKVGYYRKQWRRPGKLLLRWLRGDIDLDLALAKLSSASLALAQATMRGQARARRRQIRHTFGALQERGARVNMLISRDREAHEVFRQFFGDEGRRLKRYGDLNLTFIEGADHALTPSSARDALLAKVREAALTSSEGSVAVAGENAPAETKDFALGGGRRLIAT